MAEPRVICPWDVDSDGQRLVQDWMVDYVVSKDVPLDYLKKPSKEKTEEQVRTITKNLLGPRNFILLLSENTAYTWSLYYYLASAWITTTNKGFYILDVKEMDVNYLNEIYPKAEAASLLIIPYTDPNGWDLRKKRNILSNLLAKRKAKKQPFITDYFLKKQPATKTDIVKNIQPISNIFGEQAMSFFLSEESNSKIIKIKEA